MSTTAALVPLAQRRAARSPRATRARSPIPLLTPILFAVVIAPALKTALGGLHTKLDYTAFVSIGTVGLLVPLTTIFAGLSVIVDRDSGAQRELLAAPDPARPARARQPGRRARAQRAAGRRAGRRVATLRGADFHVSATGIVWFVAAALGFAVLMYGVAETMASRIPNQEEYIGATPVVAILPWFFAGALFPISALPGALTAFAKVLPLTHALALMRYGLVDPHGTGLHDIWGMSNTTTEAWLSLAVVVLFAAALIALAVRSFTRAALR